MPVVPLLFTADHPVFPGHFPGHLATPADVLELDFEVSASVVWFEIRSAACRIASGRFPLPQSAVV